MRIILLIIISIAFSSILKSQTFYKGDLIEMKGYVNITDSIIHIDIKNISDSVLLFSVKDVKFIKVRENYVIDQSLMTYGVSIIPPSTGEFMNLRRLKPNSHYTFQISEGCEDWDNINQINMLTRIQYLVLPYNVVILDDILNRDLISTIKKHKYSIYTFEEEVMVIDSPKSDCIKYLKIR